MALHLEERFYPHLLTTIFGRRWLLTHGIKLAISKCLNSSEYLSTLGITIADYISALQRLQSVNFSLLAELRSNKDASIEIVMNILCLEETLAERLGLTELQPHVDLLMVPVHHSPDKTVVGATSLPFALDVSNVRVRKIRENIAGQRSALRDVFIPLSEPFSAEVLTGTGDDQAGAVGNAYPFHNVDDAELNIL
nr:hypothetical protein [Tanacetum cinerariifolium]